MSIIQPMHADASAAPSQNPGMRADRSGRGRRLVECISRMNPIQVANLPCSAVCAHHRHVTGGEPASAERGHESGNRDDLNV